MKLTFNKNTVFHWTKLISLTGGSQLIIQLITMLTGILIVRKLSVTEYAIYTIANTLLGTMSVLSDSGITAGIMSEGAKCWNNKIELGITINTGMQFRKKVALIILIISLPVLMLLLRNQNANWYYCVFVYISIIPLFIANLSYSIFEIPLKLNQNIKDVQKGLLVNSITRFILVIVITITIPFTYLILIASGIAKFINNKYIIPKTKVYSQTSSNVNKKTLQSIKKVFWRTFPAGLYYTFISQITIWIMTFIGNTTSIAAIGALSRIGLIISILTTISNTLIVPMFSKIKNNQNQLFKRYILINIFLSIIVVTLTVLIYIFSDYILQLLGNNYLELNHEILLYFIGLSINFISGVSYSLSINRGWVINPILSISISVTSLIGTALFIDVTTLTGVLQFNIIISLVQLIRTSGYCIYKISKQE